MACAGLDFPRLGHLAASANANADGSGRGKGSVAQFPGPTNGVGV